MPSGIINTFRLCIFVDMSDICCCLYSPLFLDFQTAQFPTSQNLFSEISWFYATFLPVKKKKKANHEGMVVTTWFVCCCALWGILKGIPNPQSYFNWERIVRIVRVKRCSVSSVNRIYLFSNNANIFGLFKLLKPLLQCLSDAENRSKAQWFTRWIKKILEVQ